MPLEIKESIPLSRFIYEPDWTPLIGTYLLPLRFFADERSTDPNDYLEVVRVVSVAGTDVAITRGGGLYVRDRGQYQARESVNALVGIFNLLLAEFALQGLVSHPMTDGELQRAKLIGRYASITGGSSSFADRTWGPYVLLAAPKRDLGVHYGRPGNDFWPINFYWVPHDPTILDRIDGIPNALRLQEISPTLPTLLVAAVYHAARHDLAEGIVTAWIMCEELLSFVWDKYVASFPEKERRERLNDSRTYSAAVRLEVLLVAGVLKQELCDLLHEARKVRNALAHRAVMNYAAAAACNNAMREMLKYIGIFIEKLPGYIFHVGGVGGVGPPRNPLEPEFEFK